MGDTMMNVMTINGYQAVIQYDPKIIENPGFPYFSHGRLTERSICYSYVQMKEGANIIFSPYLPSVGREKRPGISNP
jgi:hypothetical protein